jgi:TusA-related sulfurtransferase
MNEPKEVELDVTGLRCPVPIVRLNNSLKALEPGDVLRVLASDPAFEMDVKAWSRRTGNELLSVEQSDGRQRARIRKIK